jgi:hypothetical protein
MKSAHKHRPGAKPSLPGHVKVYKTAVFKIHNPSQRKRAMLIDSMKRAHLAYTRLQRHLLADVERFSTMTKKERNSEMQTRVYRFLRPLPLGHGAAAGVRVDVQGQINGYIELRNSQLGAQLPTVSRLNAEATYYAAALEELTHLGSDVDREKTLCGELARLARRPRVRPVSYYGNDRSFYLFLRDKSTNRYYAWLNLHSQTSRYARPVKVENLIDVRSGEVMNFTSVTGAIFPVECGTEFHEGGFIKKRKTTIGEACASGGEER